MKAFFVSLKETIERVAAETDKNSSMLINLREELHTFMAVEEKKWEKGCSVGESMQWLRPTAVVALILSLFNTIKIWSKP
ncbi:MAG: hypothetical protein ACK4WF_05370 [Candidatus Brocadiales bacterium]